MKDNKLRSIVQFNKINIRLLLIIALILFTGILIFGATGIIRYNIEKREVQKLPELSYETKKVARGGKADVLVIIANENGLDTIEDFTGNTIYTHGKMKVAIDYKLEDRQTYQFVVRDKRGIEKTLTLNYEIPRVNGNYLLNGGIYVNSPDLRRI